MANPQESNRTLITDGEHLTTAELDQNAFRLINGFKAVFAATREFQKALSEYYLGQLDYGYRVLPDNARKVGLWKGEVYFGFEYTFTEKNHKLVIERNEKKSGQLQSEELLVLKSRRFDEMPPDLEPMIRYIGFPIEHGARVTTEDGTKIALTKGDEILSDAEIRMKRGYFFEGIKGSVDVIDSFLAGVGLSRRQLFSMREQERKRAISMLKRIAGIAFHPNNGIVNDADKLKEINNFLDQTR